MCSHSFDLGSEGCSRTSRTKMGRLWGWFSEALVLFWVILPSLSLYALFCIGVSESRITSMVPVGEDWEKKLRPLSQQSEAVQLVTLSVTFPVSVKNYLTRDNLENEGLFGMKHESIVHHGGEAQWQEQGPEGHSVHNPDAERDECWCWPPSFLYAPGTPA